MTLIPLSALCYLSILSQNFLCYILEPVVWNFFLQWTSKSTFNVLSHYTLFYSITAVFLVICSVIQRKLSCNSTINMYTGSIEWIMFAPAMWWTLALYTKHKPSVLWLGNNKHYMTDLNMDYVLCIVHQAGSPLTILFFKALHVCCTRILRNHILRERRCGYIWAIMICVYEI